MSERPTGFAAHVAAERAIRAPIEAAAETEAQQRRIHRRAESEEGQQLNNIAQAEIWGTDGRTAGYLDPATGQPLTTPIEGKLNEMRNDPANGQGTAEREEKVEQYVADIEQLRGQGYELAQAKLIMDGREADEQMRRVMVAKAVMEGKDAKEAEWKSYDWYDRKDLRRRDIIMEGYEVTTPTGGKEKRTVFTAEEYAAARAYRRGYDVGVPGAPTTVLSPAEMDRQHTLALAEDQLRSATNDARNEYARRSAGRSRRAVLFGRQFSQEAVAQARGRYEARVEQLVEFERAILVAEGIPADRIDAEVGQRATAIAIREARRLAGAVDEERLIATGRWERQTIHDPATGETRRRVVQTTPPNLRARARGRIRDWWGERDDAGSSILSSSNRGTIARRARAIATTAGIAGGFIGGGLLFPPAAIGAIGALGANRFGHYLADLQPGSRRRRSEHWAIERGRDLQDAMTLRAIALNTEYPERDLSVADEPVYDALGNEVGTIDERAGSLDEELQRTLVESGHDGFEDLYRHVADNIDEQAEGRIPANRRRVAIEVGATALGAAGGIAVGSF